MKKIIAILISVLLLIFACNTSTFAQELHIDEINTEFNNCNTHININWDDVYGATDYKLSIETDYIDFCNYITTTDTSYNWLPDLNASPNVIFDITVYAYDSAGHLIGTSATRQVYIISYLCDYFGYYGDVDCDQYISVIDATLIQMHLTNAFDFNEVQTRISDVDSDYNITVMDATYIQQFCASISGEENRTSYSFAMGWAEYQYVEII